MLDTPNMTSYHIKGYPPREQAPKIFPMRLRNYLAYPERLREVIAEQNNINTVVIYKVLHLKFYRLYILS